MDLSAIAEYPPAFVDFTTLPDSAFLAEALAVLSLPSPQLRASQWLSKHYGRYVAVGVQLRGGVIAQFTMNQANSYEMRQSYFDFSGSYGSISASATIGQAAYEALSTGNVSLAMDGIGLVSPPPIPALSTIDTAEEQSVWANSLVQLAGTAKGKRGVFLVPVSVFENGPSFELAEWDGGAIDLAGLEAYAALQTLAEACRWNVPTRLNLFLHVRVVPNSTLTYAQALYNSQDDVARALEDLKEKLRVYLTGRNSSDPVHLANLLDSKNALHQRALELASTSQSIRAMLQSLPPIEISAIDPGYSPEPANRYVRVPFRIEVRNIGYFDDDLVGPVVDWLERCSSWTDPASTFMMFEDVLEPGNETPNRPRNGCDFHFGYQDLNVSSIDFLQPVAGGPGDGLSKIRFNCEVSVHNMSQVVDLQFIDQTNRIGLLTYPLTSDGPFP